MIKNIIIVNLLIIIVAYIAKDMRGDLDFPPRKPPVYVQADCYVDGVVLNPVSELHFLTEGDLR